jgi:hypothetical protein
LYECGTSSVPLWKKNGLKVFENGVLRKIFESKREEVTEGWRNLQN